jgi:hypothetical protein
VFCLVIIFIVISHFFRIEVDLFLCVVEVIALLVSKLFFFFF